MADHEFRRRDPEQESDTDDFSEAHRVMQANVAQLPAGTMPCELGAWSEDRDPSGLNVRAEASARGRVIGRLPPPFRTKNAPEGGWLTEFKVIGYREGWFLIEGAIPPGKDYEDESYPARHPKPFAGRGWVAASKVGAQFANSGTQTGGLFQAPNIQARWTPAKDSTGQPISVDGGPKRILACSGFWALVESHDGVRGWWRSLCSNQATNCS
jgi:hypothetical protein